MVSSRLIELIRDPILNRQVHADSSNFAAGVSKRDAYEQIIEQAKALFDGQRNWVCLLCIKSLTRDGAHSRI